MTDDDLELPRCISVHGGLRVVVCAEHGSCYVKSNIARHLSKAHQVKYKPRKEIMERIYSAGIAANIEEVVRPADGFAPVVGLPVHDGFQCCIEQGNPRCRYLSTNLEAIKKHLRVVHKLKASAKGQPALARDNAASGDSGDSGSGAGYGKVKLQTLWKQTKHVDYFIVQPKAAAGHQQSGQRRQPATQEGEPQAVAEGFRARYEQVQKEYLGQGQYSKVQKLVHVSELTPWLRSTGYQAHLEGLDVDELGASYRHPAPEDEPLLLAICAGVARVLRKGMDVLESDDSEQRRLSRLNAKLLNTFARAGMSTDPIKPLQNNKSKERYIQTLQKLVCYFSRVCDGKCLGQKKMFEQTSKQLEAWDELICVAAEALLQAQARARAREREDVPRNGGRRERTEAEREMDERLDGCVLRFGVALIQQRLGGRAFDSPILSFAAVLAWDTKQNTWERVGDYTSYLSQLIYDFQLLALQHCLGLIDRGEAQDLTGCLVAFRDEWLLNDTAGPVGELLSIRLLGMAVARNTVEGAQVRWHADGETIVYKTIRLSMQDVRELVRHEVDMATAVFRRDLCFDLDDVPSYPVEKIVDNWDARAPGASFVTDGRNAALFAAGKDWLFERITRNTELMGLLLHRGPDGEWRVRTDAAKQYEDAVQRFLEHMMILLHVGSGQPARKPELLGLRWCNKQADQRNIFIHDGYVMFILTYHKLINVTNASRFPVRVLLPEVGVLLVQYLVIVQPFRVLMAHDTGIPERISENLWAEGKEVWTENKMTRVFVSRSRAAIGVRLDVRSWRQIAAGIAIKKFAGAGYKFEADGEDEGEGEGEYEVDGSGEGRGSMPEAFHWQASHTPRVGNRVYGGTVNFREGLTDAGLQEYLCISQMWHRFLADSEPRRKHGRGRSDGASQVPLAKRLARRDPRPRCRQQWSMAEARIALEQMYGPGAKYKTAKQEEAVRVVVSGLTPVIVVLGTGEGKSLLYMLPQRLPGAGTTVLIVPLVALKQDTVRRCELMGIECRVWSHEAGYGYSLGNALLIASLDQAVGVGFQSHLHKLDAAGQLNSIVFDESHLILTASNYRERMERVKQLRNLSCQLVFLTGTLPVCMVDAFTEKLLLSRAVVIRGVSVRKDIRYTVKQCEGEGGDMVDVAVQTIKAMLRAAPFAEEPEARAIAYTRTKAQADEVARRLVCPVYYSDSGTEEEKAEVLEGWLQGKARILAATSAFGAGIDYGRVRAVFHVGELDGAIDFAQEVGRGGRDGRGSVSLVFLPKGWKAKTRDVSGELLCADAMAMQRYLDAPRCRLAPLSEFLDGAAQFCDSAETACDRCVSLGLVAEKERLEWREWGKVGEGGWDGAGMLRRFECEQERVKQEFIGNLRAVEGKCMICMASGVGEGLGHTLSECRSAEKHEFFGAKKRAIERGAQQGRGWMARFSGCYRCGLPQGVCEKLGQGGCRYYDVVMPLSWAAYRVHRWRRVVLEAAGRQFGSMDDYMEWLGGAREVFGEKGSNMAQVGMVMVAKLAEVRLLFFLCKPFYSV